MKTLKGYEKLVMIDLGQLQPNGEPWPVKEGYMNVDGQAYLSSDISNRMLILAMRDFIKELSPLLEGKFLVTDNDQNT